MSSRTRIGGLSKEHNQASNSAKKQDTSPLNRLSNSVDTVNTILSLQRTIGNSAVIRMLKNNQFASQQSISVQRKWIDDKQFAYYKWDEVTEGVRWYFHKSANLMYYMVENPELVSEEILAQQGKPKTHEAWLALGMEPIKEADPSIVELPDMLSDAYKADRKSKASTEGKKVYPYDPFSIEPKTEEELEEEKAELKIQEEKAELQRQEKAKLQLQKEAERKRQFDVRKEEFKRKHEPSSQVAKPKEESVDNEVAKARKKAEGKEEVVGNEVAKPKKLAKDKLRHPMSIKGFEGATNTAHGSGQSGLNQKDNLGKYVYHVTSLRNLLADPTKIEANTGIQNIGLDPARGGKTGGSCEACTDEELKKTSVTGSKNRVAVGNSQPVFKEYLTQREDVSLFAPDEDKVPQGGVVLRFKLTEQYMQRMVKDPDHDGPNVRLIEDRLIPPNELEILTHEGWMHLLAVQNLEAIMPTEILGATVRDEKVKLASASGEGSKEEN